MGGAGGRTTQQNLGAFFVARCVELYLRMSGRFGLVRDRGGEYAEAGSDRWMPIMGRMGPPSRHQSSRVDSNGPSIGTHCATDDQRPTEHRPPNLDGLR